MRATLKFRQVHVDVDMDSDVVLDQILNENSLSSVLDYIRGDDEANFDSWCEEEGIAESIDDMNIMDIIASIDRRDEPGENGIPATANIMVDHYSKFMVKRLAQSYSYLCEFLDQVDDEILRIMKNRMQETRDKAIQLTT